MVQVVKNCLQCRRPRFYPQLGKIPWRRKWLPTPVFLPGESHEQRSLTGYSAWGHRVGLNLGTKQSQPTKGAKGNSLGKKQKKMTHKSKPKTTATCREPAYCILSAYCIVSAALSTASSFRIWNSSTRILSLLGASVRHSTHDKGHEEGGSAYAKVGSSLRSPPGNSRASTPKTRVCLLSALCFHLHL